MVNSPSRRVMLRLTAKAVHKDNLQAHRYNAVVKVVRDASRTNSRVGHAFVFYLDPPHKSFGMTDKGDFVQRKEGSKHDYIKIDDLRLLSHHDFDYLATLLKNWKKMKAKEIAPFGTPGFPH